jgi:hypothetical protein
MCIELLGHEGEQLGRQSKQRKRRRMMERGGCESRHVPDYLESSLVRGATAVSLDASLHDARWRCQHVVEWRLFASGPVRPARLRV